MNNRNLVSWICTPSHPILGRAVLLLWIAGSFGCHTRAAPRWIFEPAARPIVDQASVAPQLLVLTSGDILATLVEQHEARDNLAVYTSSTAGDVFTRALQLNTGGEAVRSDREGTPRLLMGHAGTYYALWSGSSNDGKPMELLYVRSRDFGHSFSRPIPLDAQGGGSHPYFNVAVTPDGIMRVVWIAYDNIAGMVPGTGVLQIIGSTDSGRTFSAARTIATNVCPCCRPELLVDNAGIWYLSWRHVDPDQERDIVIAASHDHGLTWSKEVRVSKDGWHINGCPESGPALASFHGKLFVAWHSVVSGEQRAFWSESDDGGIHFARRQDLADNVRDPNHPFLAQIGDRLVVAFQGRNADDHAGWGHSRIYFRQIAPLVETAVVLPSGPGSAAYPVVAALEAKEVIVAWTDTPEQGSMVFSARGQLKE